MLIILYSNLSKNVLDNLFDAALLLAETDEKNKQINKQKTK